MEFLMSPNRTKEPETLSIPEAAERLGIGRNSAYDAARRGEIPTIRIGKLLRVPVVRLERLLAGDKAAA